MYPKGRQIVLKKEGDRVRVGWVGTLEQAAIKFQDGGSEETTKGWRHALYKRGFLPGEVPRVAATPQRPVIDQAIESTRKHMADWTLGALDKFLRERISRLDLKYRKNAGTRAGARAAMQSVDAIDAANDLQEFTA